MDQDGSHNTEITVADPNEQLHESLMQFDNDEEESSEEDSKEETTKE
jgi:hypothetical protein